MKENKRNFLRGYPRQYSKIPGHEVSVLAVIYNNYETLMPDVRFYERCILNKQTGKLSFDSGFKGKNLLYIDIE